MYANDEEYLKDLARIDWVYFHPYDFIHAVKSACYNVEEWVLEDVVTECGLLTEEASIPGILSRMEMIRCPACCKATGLPEGQGSPKNDTACRKLLNLPEQGEQSCGGL